MKAKKIIFIFFILIIGLLISFLAYKKNNIRGIYNDTSDHDTPTQVLETDEKKALLENQNYGKIWSEEELKRILENEERSNDDMEVTIESIEENETKMNIKYSIQAKKDLYVVDYNKINCENEIRERLIVKNTLYIIFHAGMDLQCKPGTDYYVSPPWTLVNLKKDHKISFDISISKDDFDDAIYKKYKKDIKNVKLVFGYVPEENLKESKSSVEKIDNQYIETRSVEVELNRYKIIDTDIKWN